MQESETHFNNVSMPAFKIPIIFRSVRRCSEMGYTMGCKEGPKSYIFTPIIYVKGCNGGGEIVFSKVLEGDNG